MIVLFSGVYDEDGTCHNACQQSYFTLASQATIVTGPPLQFTIPITNTQFNLPFPRIAAMVCDQVPGTTNILLPS